VTIADRTYSRATQRFERKREAILDGATHLLNHAGVRGLTLADAAARVGLSTTSVTYYFKRKEDLAAAVLLRGIESLAANTELALEAPTPQERLRRLVELHFERLRQGAAGEAPPLPSFADIRALNPPRRSEVIGAFMGLFRKTRQLFDAPELSALSRGRRTARTHLLLEQLFWASVWLRRFDPEDYPRLAARVIDVLIGGLAPAGAAWAPQAMPLGQLAGADPREMSRETFLLAATRLINARGYRGASVELISAELNVTKGSFYHHIDAKDDLVVACFERTFEVMRRVQRMAAQEGGDEWSRLVNAAATLAEFQLSEHGPLLRSSALSALPEPIRARMVEQSNRVSDRFAAMISDGIAEGSIRPVDPTIAAQMLNATLNAGAELGIWVPGVKQKAAPAVFVRPLLMGVFETGAARG
jgi:AcrR family transcriptional regulator